MSKASRLPLALCLAILVLSTQCKDDKPKRPDPVKPKPQPEVTVPVPAFDPDRAYSFIQAQVDFGPRVPESSSHEACGDWLLETLRGYAGNGQVSEQPFRAKRFDGQAISGRNIIARFGEGSDRILLCAHWDTRMFADYDRENRRQPIPGANDGGSGVAVLLEIARAMTEDSFPTLPIDIVLFDVEDQGYPSGLGYPRPPNSDETWCLGSQYWSRNMHDPGTRYRFGILLDMVGTINAKFPKERHSLDYAKNVVNKIWARAAKLGHSQYFISQEGPPILDDHYFVNSVAGVPTVDIIHYHPDNGQFNSTWHTHDDDMGIIDRNTLHAVGQTVLHVIYHEYPALAKTKE